MLFMKLDSAMLTVLKNQSKMLSQGDYLGEAHHLRKGSQHPDIWGPKLAVLKKSHV